MGRLPFTIMDLLLPHLHLQPIPIAKPESATEAQTIVLETLYLRSLPRVFSMLQILKKIASGYQELVSFPQQHQNLLPLH